jgi:hypothetical protein
MRAIMAAVLLVSAATTVYGVEMRTDDTYECLYFLIGGGGAFHSLGGDFDGESFFMTGDYYYEMFVVPEVEGAVAWSAMVGARRGWLSLEAMFARSTHDMTWAGASTSGSQWTLSGNGRAYFRISGPMEFDVLLGGTLVGVRVEDGYAFYDEWSGEFRAGDADFYGLGLNVGAGLTYHATQHVALQCDVVCHPTMFTGASSEQSSSSESYTIEDLNDASTDVTLQVIFYVGPF